MQVIQLHHPYEPNQIPNEEVVMVLGFFDGVHKGHQKVIETGKKIAEEKGLKLAVMTFNQHINRFSKSFTRKYEIFN